MSKEIKRKNRRIKLLQQKIAKLEMAEAKVRAKWDAEYHRHLKYAKELALREQKKAKRGSKKVEKMANFINGWNSRSDEITKERNLLRAEIQATKAELSDESLDLKKLQLQWDNDLQANDQLISLIFSLNDKVIEALEERNRVLSESVYRRLVKENGDLRSQISLENSSGTMKITALVNSIQIIKTELAEAAKEEIQNFFDRYSQAVLPDNPTLKQLYRLTQELLISKNNFKIGPSFYVFISLKIDENQFPELAKAQNYLRASVRSVKTNSYIKLYHRNSRSDKWVQIKQK